MVTFVLVLHVVVSFALIIIVLLQAGKGADLGAVFGGGGSKTVFGAQGAGGPLSKITIGAAIMFMFTCIYLAIASSSGIGGSGIMGDEAGPAPKPPVAAPMPTATSETITITPDKAGLPPPVINLPIGDNPPGDTELPPPTIKVTPKGPEDLKLPRAGDPDAPVTPGGLDLPPPSIDVTPVVPETPPEETDNPQ